MTLEAETTRDIDPLTAGLQAVAGLQEITEDDLQELRQKFYRAGQFGHEQILQIFEVHRKMPTKDGLWIEFFIEAVAEFFLTRRADQIFLTEVAEEQLFSAIGGPAPIIDPGHRRLVLRLFLRITKVSKCLQNLVFDLVYRHLLEDKHRLLVDLRRQAGMVDILDLQLIRKLVFGVGRQDPATINRIAVGFLLRLDQSPLTFSDLETWKNLLLKAVSYHITTDHAGQDQSLVRIDEDAARRLIEHIHAHHKGRHKAALIAHLTCSTDVKDRGASSSIAPKWPQDIH